MTEMQIIEQREVLGKDFKIYGDYENPLFLAKDVAEWIEHSNARMMLQSVDDDEKVVKNAYTLGGNQEQWFLTENGLYEVLMQSRKPIAKAFKKEVKEILKQIRKTGAYIPVKEEESDEEFLARALLVAQRTLVQKEEILKQKEQEIKVIAEELIEKSKFISQLEMSENSLLVRDVAKIVSNADIVIGERKLWAKLREWGLIYKNSTEPKQYGINRGYFEVNIGIKESKGKVFTYKTTRVTGKGQAYILKRLLKESV